MALESLHEKLQEIARLEREHKLLGARIALKDPAHPLTTEEAVDFVLESTRKTVELLERFDEVPVVSDPSAD